MPRVACRLLMGDGILSSGRTLYVVQNVLNQVAVVRLDHSGTSGGIVAHVTDPRFDVPTTVAQVGSRGFTCPTPGSPLRPCR